MNSPILEYLAAYGIDTAYILIGLLVLVLILFVLYIRLLGKFKKISKTYARFMKGKSMDSMEDLILKQFDRIEFLEKSDKEKRHQIQDIFANLKEVYQKTGLVRYNAFREMSGELSYALALLDNNDNGVLINSMYSREGCYSYVKEIVKGKSAIHLSEEEEAALTKALGSEI